MAFEERLENITVPSAGDLSTSQYRFVDINSAGKVATVSSLGAKAIGVLQNKPGAADRAATVATGGTSKVLSAGTIAAGADVTTSADGRAVAAATGQKILGRAVKSAVAGDIFPVHLTPGAANAA